MDLAVNVPANRNSLEHSKIISRQDFALFKLYLLCPIVMQFCIAVTDRYINRSNVYLSLQIAVSADDHHDPLKSYQEAVIEEPKEKSGDDNDNPAVYLFAVVHQVFTISLHY